MTVDSSPVLDRSTYRRFGRTELAVSPLGFGGAPIGVLEDEIDDSVRLLNGLLDAGVNVIDTATAYRGSEAMIGRAIGSRRDEYVLISKCGRQIDGCDAPDWSPELIAATIDRSLERLQTDHLDVMLLHTCELEVLKAGDALGALVAARDAGKIRFAGFSGDNDAAAWAAGNEDITVIQTSLSMCDQVNLNAVIPAAADSDVGIMAKRPVANAAWKGLDGQYEQYRNYAQPYHARFEAMGLSLKELGLEGDPAVVWPEIALRFTLGFEGVHTAIVGTTRPENVRANLAAAAKGPLSAGLVATIRAAFVNAIGDDGWPGLT